MHSLPEENYVESGKAADAGSVGADTGGLGAGMGDLALRLSAILVHPQQEITRDLYLSLLGDRIQRLVNACPDPKDAVRNLKEDLFEAGLLPDVGRVPVDEAGAYLCQATRGRRSA